MDLQGKIGFRWKLLPISSVVGLRTDVILLIMTVGGPHKVTKTNTCVSVYVYVYKNPMLYYSLCSLVMKILH